MMGPIGLPELVVIFCILMLSFGAHRLSGLGKGLGQAIRGFKGELNSADTEADNEPPRAI